MNVYLGQTCDAALIQTSNRTVVLQVLAQGELKINETSFTLDGLGPALAMIYERRQERLLRIVGAREASYEQVVRAIAEAKTFVPDLVILLMTNSAPEAVWNTCPPTVTKTE